MTNDEHIKRKIEEAMDSIGKIKRATPAPYLLTRINARLNNRVKTFWENTAGFITKPAVLLWGLCLLLAVNISVLLVNRTSSVNTATERSVNAVAEDDEYSTSFASIDNFENQ